MWALVLLLLALVTLAQVMRAQRKRRSGEPPLIQGWIPYLGKALDWKKDSFKLMEDLRRKHGDVFTVLIAGRYMTFILNPLHFPAIIKHSRHLDFHKFSNIVAPYAFGYPDLTSERFPGLAEEAYNTLKLLQGVHLSPLSETMMKNLQLVFREDHLNCGEWRTSLLYDFCLRVSFEATFMTIFGRSASEQRHRDIEKIRQNFIYFDEKIPLLMAQVPLWLLGNIKCIRDKLIDSLTLTPDWTQASLFIQRRNILYNQYQELSHHDKAAQHLAILWASVGNTAPALFWCLFYLLRHQEALQAVRAELQEVMSQEGLELRPDSDLVLPGDLLDRLVVLESVVSESLRLSTMSINVRVAGEDFRLRLDSSGPVWSIRKGDTIALFPQSTHLDPEIYPEPTSFQFDRYLDDGKQKTDFYKSGERLKHFLIPFGSGTTKCPGRHLALQEIKQFMCLVLLLFEVELCDPSAAVKPDLSRAGLGIMQPAHDTSFRYRLRCPLATSM